MGKEKKLELYPVGGKREWFKIRYVGMIDVGQLYATLQHYLRSHGYRVVLKEQTEAAKASGKEEVVEWEATKGISPYVQYVVNVQVWMYRGVEVLVEEGGSRQRKMSATLEVRFRAMMQKNFRPVFQKKLTHEYARQVYEKYIAKQRLAVQEDALAKEASGLIDEARRVLGLVRA